MVLRISSARAGSRALGNRSTSAPGARLNCWATPGSRGRERLADGPGGVGVGMDRRGLGVGGAREGGEEERSIKMDSVTLEAEEEEVAETEGGTTTEVVSEAEVEAEGEAAAGRAVREAGGALEIAT